MNRIRARGYERKFGDFQIDFSRYRCRERADDRTVDAWFLMRMTQNASLFIRADVPMHDGRKRRDSENRHDQQ